MDHLCLYLGHLYEGERRLVRVPPDPKCLLVKATRIGYYGGKRRYQSHTFELTDPDHFEPRWMEWVKK